MSIYATWLAIDDDNHTEKCNRYVRIKRRKKGDAWQALFGDNRYYEYDATRPCTCDEKAPIVYQGSHVNPDDTDARGGVVMVCAIPNFCHPTALGADGPGEKVWFLRLSVSEDPATYHGLNRGDATVVLDRKQVMELHETLTSWLAADDVA